MSEDMKYHTINELIEVAEKLSTRFNQNSNAELQALADLCKMTLERQQKQDELLDSLQQEIRRISKLQAKTLLSGPKS